MNLELKDGLEEEPLYVPFGEAQDTICAVEGNDEVTKLVTCKECTDAFCDEYLYSRCCIAATKRYY